MSGNIRPASGKGGKREIGGRRGDGKKNPNADPPLYRIVVKTLQSEIVRGIYPVGTQLPSESALMERFSVSRHTIREALRALREAGLVRSHQGLGTLVQRPGGNQGYVHEINTISDLFPVNVETRYEPVGGKLAPLPDWARFFPEVDDDRTWLRIRGQRCKPGESKPFNDLDSFVAARFAGVGRALGQHSGSIYGVLETIYGETIKEVEQVIGAFISDGEIGKTLGMKKGDVGLEIRRIYRIASDNDIAIISFNRYLPNTYNFAMTLRRVRN